MTFPDQVNGYLVVPVLVNGSQSKTNGHDVSQDVAQGKAAIYHIIYMKKHEDRVKSGSEDRKIFAANLPIDTSLASIKALCQEINGSIVEEFKLESGNRGIITLVDKTTCTKLLSKIKTLYKLEGNPIEWPRKEEYGKKRYLLKNRQKFPRREQLQRKVDAVMEAFAKAEEIRLKEVQKLSSKQDEDGFTMVVNNKRRSKAGIAAASAASGQILQAEASKKRKRSKEKTDFYRFQIREQKKTEMSELLHKFRKDQEKIKELREQKRFKPFSH